jgi:hypothetical protein
MSYNQSHWIFEPEIVGFIFCYEAGDAEIKNINILANLILVWDMPKNKKALAQPYKGFLNKHAVREGFEPPRGI